LRVPVGKQWEALRGHLLLQMPRYTNLPHSSMSALNIGLGQSFRKRPFFWITSRKKGLVSLEFLVFVLVELEGLPILLVVAPSSALRVVSHLFGRWMEDVPDWREESQVGRIPQDVPLDGIAVEGAITREAKAGVFEVLVGDLGDETLDLGWEVEVHFYRDVGDSLFVFACVAVPVAAENGDERCFADVALDDGGEDVQNLDELVGGCRYDVALAVQCLLFFGVQVFLVLVSTEDEGKVKLLEAGACERYGAPKRAER